MKKLLYLSIGFLLFIPQLTNANTIFEIKSLDNPVSLVGNWLFTRDDDPNNALVEIDTKNWKKVRAPGS